MPKGGGHSGIRLLEIKHVHYGEGGMSSQVCVQLSKASPVNHGSGKNNLVGRV